MRCLGGERLAVGEDAIAHKADNDGSTLREAALALGVSAVDFHRIVNPETMVGHPRRDLGLEPQHGSAT